MTFVRCHDSIGNYKPTGFFLRVSSLTGVSGWQSSRASPLVCFVLTANVVNSLFYLCRRDVPQRGINLVEKKNDEEVE